MFGDVVKWVAEIDEAARVPEFLSRAFHVAMSGRPGPVVLALPEDMLRETRRRAAAAALRAGRDLSRPDPDGAAAEAALGGQEAVRDRSAARAGATRRSRRCSASPSGSTCRSASPSAARACSTMSTRIMPAMSASASIPALAARIKEADLLLLLGGRMSEMPSSGYTLIDSPGAAAGPRPCACQRRGTRPRLPADARDQRDAERLRRAARSRASAGHDPLERGDPRRQRRLSRLVRAGAARGRRCRARRGDAHPARTPARRTRSSPMAPATMPSGCTAIYRFRGSSTQLAPTSGSMGYGVPAAIAAKLQLSRAHGHRLCRRRLLPDDGPGIRHRRAGGRGDHRHRRRQRHVRHDPRASGAELSRPRRGDGAGQSGFRRAGPRLWRPWRDGRDDRGFLRRPSSGRRPAASRRSCICRPIRRRSRQARRSPRCGNRQR